MTDIPAPKDARHYCGFHGGPHQHIHRSKVGGEPPIICIDCTLIAINKWIAAGVVGFEDAGRGKALPPLAVYKGA